MATSSDLDLFDQVAAEVKASPVPIPTGRKVTGVTAANYGQLAGVYLSERSGGHPFVIVGRFVTINGDRMQPTIDQWAAWKAFFKSIGRPTTHMENAGYATVPCEFPHDFASQWTAAMTADAVRAGRKDLQNTIAAQKAAAKDPADELAERAAAKRNLERVKDEMSKFDPVPPLHTRSTTEED